MSSSSNTTTNVINPKPCNYNCGTRIYWNTISSEYWEVFTKKKHICPNRVSKSVTVTNKPLDVQNAISESINPISYPAASTTSNTKPHITTKNHGIRNQNQRYPTHLNC